MKAKKSAAAQAGKSVAKPSKKSAAARSRPRVARAEPELFRARTKKRMPFEFVLDELSELVPETKPMFGCQAVYVGERIVMILRDRPTATHDNGVWLATTIDHHASLAADFPSLRSITVLGAGVTGWQVLPADADDFEESVLRACAFVRGGDPRIGKIPAARKPRTLTKR